MNLPTFIAFRHLRSPQKGSFSTLAGILAIAGLGIGIAALIITLSILEGFETTISEKIAGFDGHIRLQHFMDTPVPEENLIGRADTVLLSTYSCARADADPCMKKRLWRGL